ncbi:hypothetical protein MMSR116_17825 [Methylobacterium mesophilicum SR1.6/6]|uniref:Uncharacterized protein n=1 Tax=Methylobacterium mesophilicum SR1.6/6 TaxID=908290 RepID=A0A6B9FMA4_9HYPH|nr:hypothetical protein [Methylobacterium mesophilicum]QGY03537.1 hypothetical protein MMSR116_17825 [Methylobacterium mesophilicum SR1.6/6]
MATQPYRLTALLLLAGSNSDTTQQTVTIAAETTEEAVELAQVVRAGLPSEAVVSATLTDTNGTVLWSEQGGAPHEVLLQEDPT